MIEVKSLDNIFSNFVEKIENMQCEIVKLKSENKNLLTEIESMQREKSNNKYENLNEKESLFRHFLHKVAGNNGFLVQQFKDYSNLEYCYENFIKHGFEVQQVGIDTLIIRNK